MMIEHINKKDNTSTFSLEILGGSPYYPEFSMAFDISQTSTVIQNQITENLKHSRINNLKYKLNKQQFIDDLCEFSLLLWEDFTKTGNKIMLELPAIII